MHKAGDHIRTATHPVTAGYDNLACSREIKLNFASHVNKATTLALPDTQVTGAGLVHLEPLPRLRVLNLNGCAVTDESLESLAGLKNLRMLHVHGSKVTDAGARKFKAKMSGLAIYYD